MATSTQFVSRWTYRLALALLVLITGCWSAHVHGGKGTEVAALRQGSRVVLCSPQFRFTFDVSDGLRAATWENGLAGKTLNLGGGSELDIDLDAAERRIGISGWKFARSQEVDGPPAEEAGLRAGFARSDFDDSSWTAVMTPNGDFAPRTGYAWVRRHLKLPDSDRGKPAFITMGGFGLFDFRHLQIFLNGEPLGSRDPSRRRAGPLTVAVQPGADAYRLLRFGDENVIALQLGRYENRLARLDAVDPEHRWDLSRFYWPPTFEQTIAIGGDRITPKWKVTDVCDQSHADLGQIAITLASKEPSLEATVTYRWSADDSVLRKFVRIRNTGDQSCKILDVRLGNYHTGMKTTEGEQGHPVYADSAFFFGVAHPAGWSTGEDGEILLHHHPGVAIAPGKEIECFETVYGVSKSGEIEEAFTDHIRSRMRRVIRGHDHPYAFFEPFGSDGEKDKYDAREDRLLPSLAALETFLCETGCRFDAWTIEFWEDLHGDRSAPDRVRFPNGFQKIRQSLARMGTSLGLWLDITGPDQSIGKNPAIAPTLNSDPAFGTERNTMCLATEPMPELHREAFARHLRDGVRLFKFDGYWAACRNNAHAHLPGIYATEAIDSAFIATLKEMDAACPEAFFQLYGGYHSPWWLLHADTIFESGIQMEAATPGPWPTLYARDGVTRVLDQARVYSGEDVPALGKDSLGVWLSDWRWDSQIRSERWEEGFVMDLARGSLLAQPWCDVARLSSEERRHMANFIALLREYPKCFDRTRLILGSPWKPEPYGWCGTDGHRAFIAINNGTWEDRTIELKLNREWGLPDHRRWDVYRLFPSPAKLDGGKIALRPFEILLLEAVPAGEPPLRENFVARPESWSDSSVSPDVQIGARDPDGFQNVGFEIPPTARGGTIAVTADVRLNGLPLMRTDAGSHYEIAPAPNIAVEWTPVLAKQLYYKTSWQAWRAAVAPSNQARTFALRIRPDAPLAAVVSYRAYFIPR